MEPERPIEKLLRAFAKKRRDDAGAPLEPHPATRRMLQGEVARQFPKAAAGGATKVAGLATWWPRLAWAASVLVVLGVSVWAFFPRQQNPRAAFDLAQNSLPQNSPARDKKKLAGAPAESEAKPAPTKQPDQPTLASANTTPAQPQNATVTWSADTLNFKDETKLGTAPAQPHIASSGLTLSETPGREPQPGARLDAGLAVAGGEQAKAVNLALAPPVASAGALVPGSSGGGGFGGAGGGGQEARNRTAAFTVAGSPPTASLPSLAGGATNTLADLFNRSTANGVAFGNTGMLRQNFVQTQSRGQFKAAAKPAEPNQVLASFQIERAGNQLRVIDNDGSTYTGGIEMAVDEKASSTVTTQTGAALPKSGNAIAASQITAAPAANFQNAQNFSFRVAGTNRTLNQQVVFTGNFLEATNEMAAQMKASRLQNTGPAQAQQAFPMLLNSTINGRAQVGGGKEIEINAVPTAP